MAKGFKKTTAFIFFILAGIVLGGFISHICASQQYLGWLAWGQQIGLSTNSPAVIDLVIIKFAIGFELNVTVAQIFTVILSILLFNKTCKSL